MSTPERTGDPFKDFDLDLKKVESDAEATKYIKLGRESTYKFIDLLYRTDWEFEKKTAEGVKIYSMKNSVEDPNNYVRFETKFGQVTVSELVEYFRDIDKRMAWENNYYTSLEVIRSYALKTDMYYGKLVKKGSTQRDQLMVTHSV